MKICLVRNDKMGDMILTLPVVQGRRFHRPAHAGNGPTLL